MFYAEGCVSSMRFKDLQTNFSSNADDLFHNLFRTL